MPYFLRYEEAHPEYEFTDPQLHHLDEPTKPRICYCNGPWSLPLESCVEYELPEDLQSRVLEAQLQTRIRWKLREFSVVRWDAMLPGPKPNPQGRAGIREWLAQPDSQLRYYTLKGGDGNAYGGMGLHSPVGDRHTSIMREDYHGIGHEIFEHVGIFNLASIGEVRILAEDLERFGLPQSTTLRSGGKFSLDEIIQVWKSTDPWHKSLQKDRPALVSEERFKSIVAAYYQVWWGIEDGIAAEFGVEPIPDYEQWQKASDRVLEIILHAYDQGLRHFETLGLRGWGMRILDAAKLRHEIEIQRHWAKVLRGVSLSEEERGPYIQEIHATSFCQSAYGEFWVMNLADWDDRNNPIPDALIKALEQIALTHAEPIWVEWQGTDKIVKGLRNPSGSEDAIRLGMECESFILEYLDKQCDIKRPVYTREQLDERREGLFGSMPVHPTTGEYYTVDPDSCTLMTWEPAGRFEEVLSQRWLHADLKTPEVVKDLPDQFWKHVGASPRALHLDLLFAWKNGRAKDGAKAELVAKAIMAIIHKWPKLPELKALETAGKRTTLFAMSGQRIADWKKVVMKFVNGETVSLQMPAGGLRDVTFEMMGALDGRNMGPNTAWKDLIKLADQNQEILLSRERKRALQEMLQSFFEIDGDALSAEGKEAGETVYKARFLVLPEENISLSESKYW